MKINGHLVFEGGGQLKTARLENLAADPGTPVVGQVWYNTVSKYIKYYDGTAVVQIAVGAALSDYLALAGGTMLGDIVLAGAPTLDLHPATKKYADDGLALKEPVITGAATTIVQSNLTVSAAVVSDSSGKVAAHGTTTAAEVGHLTGVTSGIQTQLNGKEPTIGYVPVNKAGDTLSGNLAFGGSSTVTGLAAPTGNTDAVRKIDLENALAGLDFQPDILNVQVDNTLDPGATPATGARFVVTDSANLHANFGTITGVGDNDIVEYNGTAWVITYDVSVKGEGAICWNRNLTTWEFYNGTVWAEFGGLAGVTAGVGLSKSGNTIEVNLGAGISQLPSDEIGVDILTAGALFLTVDGSAASTDTAAQLSILIDGTTLSRSATGIKVPAGGITETELNASTIANGLQGAAGTAISVKADTGIAVTASGVAVDTTWADARYINAAGDTMTGDLTLNAAPTVALHAATKQYVDDVDTKLTTLKGRYEASFVVVDSSTPATSHIITHNIGTKFCNVTVVSGTDEVIMPDSITYNSTTALTVTFTSSIACKVIVSGLNPAV
jgi:hypothetical protein